MEKSIAATTRGGGGGISVVVPFKDDNARLSRALEACSKLDEIIIFDNGPTPGVEEVCAPYSNVRIVKGEFHGFGQLRNDAAKHARNDWIFALDSDEWPNEELTAFLENFQPTDPRETFGCRRETLCLGKKMRFPNRDHQRHFRLYNRQHTEYSSKLVHESLIIPNGSIKQELPGKLWHDTTCSVAQMLDKINLYTELLAPALSGPVPTAGNILIRSIWRFFHYYVLRLAMLDGWYGLLRAVNTFNTTFYKHMKRKAAHAQDVQLGKTPRSLED